MTKTVFGRRLLVGGTDDAVAVVLGFSDAVAAAEPVLPLPPAPDYAPAFPQVVPLGPPASAPGAVPLPAAAPGPAAAVPSPVVPPARVPAGSDTLRDYFAAKDVRLAPQQAAGFSPLDITLPVPGGWTQVPDPNVPDAFVVIANRNSGSLYTPNAQVVVYRLVGDFDAGEAITHGYVDSQKLPAWQTTNASLADFGGFPSSVIEGTYRQNDQTLNTSRRHVIAASGAGSYLVSMSVTTEARESVGTAPATDAIVNGFQVSVPGTTPAPPATVPAPPAGGRSAQPRADP